MITATACSATGAMETAATGDTFSYADYLGRRGVFTIMRNAGLEVVSEGGGDPVFARLLEMKAIVRGEIAKALPEPQAGLLTGILLGDESGISPQLKDDFRRVGASHIIAISGFNMVIVSAIVVRVLSSLFAGKGATVTIGAVAVIAVYSLFVGASPSILRAAFMSSLLVIGNQLKRRTFLPASLAFATLLLSLLDPNVLLDIGFQLSFFAVLGLGLFADPLSRDSPRCWSAICRRSWPQLLHSFLNEPLIVSVAAQLATLPLIIFYFGRLSLVALPVNLLIVPAQSAVLLLGLVGGRGRRIRTGFGRPDFLGGYDRAVLDDFGCTRLRAAGFRRCGACDGRAHYPRFLHCANGRGYVAGRAPAVLATHRAIRPAQQSYRIGQRRFLRVDRADLGNAIEPQRRQIACLAA